MERNLKGSNIIKKGPAIVTVDITLNGANKDHYFALENRMELRGFNSVDCIQTAWYGDFSFSGSGDIDNFLKFMSDTVDIPIDNNVGGHAMIQIGNQCVILAEIKIRKKGNKAEVNFSFDEMLLP